MSHTQFAALKILKYAESPQLSLLAEMLQISRPAASKNIEQMVQMRLVERTILKEDRRGAIARLTAKGQKLIDDFETYRESLLRNALSTFSQDEQKKLNKMLESLARHSVEQEEGIEVICLKCQGNFLEQWTAIDDSGDCRYFQKVE